MPKPRKKESIQCQFFRWLIYLRDTTFYADGRSNAIKLGRYTLDATTREDALKNLTELDLNKAVEHGLADKSLLHSQSPTGLTIEEGWRMYMDSIDGRRVLEGLSAKTSKRYRAVRDKFSKYCKTKGITHCRQLSKNLLMAYAAWLDGEGYAYATEYLEITTIKQLVNHLIAETYLPSSMKINLAMPKPTETDTYCYRPVEVDAILHHCRTTKECQWLHAPTMTMAYTGMRISELASLRLTDIDFEHNRIVLTDERHSVAHRKAGTARKLKGKRSRSFPIPAELLPILRDVSRCKDGLVFHGPLGGRLKPDTVRRCLIRDVLTPLSKQFPTPDGDAVGFADGRLHSFRHFFCSVCANSGDVTEQILMSWLGHRSSQMIRRYYHLHDTASQQAMKKVKFAITAAPE